MTNTLSQSQKALVDQTRGCQVLSKIIPSQSMNFISKIDFLIKWFMRGEMVNLEN
jgi:hypothetical protein